MSDPRRPAPRLARVPYRAGTYLSCPACGRLLRIEWAIRSIVCSCGQRITPPSSSAKGGEVPGTKK